MKYWNYAYAYSPASLTMTREFWQRNWPGSYKKVTQTVPLDTQGRVSYPPGITPMFYWNDTGISSMFKDLVFPFASDTLRAYNKTGFLDKTWETYRQPTSPFRVYCAQEVVNGNVVWRQNVKETMNLLEPSREVVSTTTSRFDLSKPGLRNPFQFLGSTNQNLILSTQMTGDNGRRPFYEETYQYEYDGKGRVKRYVIRTENYITVGDIEYANP